MARVHLAEAARPRAAFAVDHEGRRAVGPALVDVRAPRLLAHGDQPEVVDRGTRAGDSPCRCARAPAPSPACVARCRGPPRARPPPGAGGAGVGARPLPSTGRAGGPGPGRRRGAPPSPAPKTAAARATNASTTASIGTSMPSAASDVTPAIGDAARHDVTEHGEVGGHVEGDAVEGPAAPRAGAQGPHPDGRDLPGVAGRRRRATRLDTRPRCVAPPRPRSASVCDHHLLEPVHVRRARRRVVGHRDDRVGHQLARPVVRDVAAAVGALEHRTDQRRVDQHVALVGVGTRACRCAGVAGPAGSRRPPRSPGRAAARTPRGREPSRATGRAAPARPYSSAAQSRLPSSSETLARKSET